MTNFYIVGGTLAADALSYIKRQADDIFYQALKDGQFCYILNSRQMGKSSLWVQTQKRLEAEGVRCVDVDLTKIGKSPTEESWYRVIFYELVKSFQLSINPQRKAWWDEGREVSPIQRLTQFVEEVLLEEVKQPIVICLDEIDSVLSLNFAIDPFFAWIRACYNQRANRAIYQRLTFCVMGVATVSNFIRDRTRTPFNIGKDISLSGFTKSDARVLATGLEGKVSNPERVLEEVLEWTGGQPFLTQKLCQLIYESRSDNLNSEQEIDVRDFVRSRIIDNWEEQDNPQHLRTIRHRLLFNPSTGRRMLKLYQEILAKGEIPDDSSPERIQLRLTGLVVQQNRRLKAYNKIYQQVFDRSWVKKELNQIPPFLQQYEAWLNSGEDSSELLSSEDLEEALEWSKDKSLEQSQTRFLQLSQIEEQQISRERRERDAYETAEYILESEFEEEQLRKIINQILSWTGDRGDLIEMVCQLVIQQKNSPEEKEKSIEELIQEKIIDNWQEGLAAEHLTEMQSHLLGNHGDRLSNLSKLQTYQEILQGRAIADEQPEKLALLEVKLIINNDGWLEIANRIYREVFNLSWVNQELDHLAESQNQPANLTKLFSLSILVIFSLVVVWTVGSKKEKPPKQPPPPITQTPITPNTPEPSLSTTETPTICTKRESSRENDIKKLEALKPNPNLFSSQCKTQLKELKLITRAVGLAKDGMIAKNEFGEDAFGLLCQIPTDSINIGEAKYWVNRWYQDEPKKADIDKALKDNPQCEQLID